MPKTCTIIISHYESLPFLRTCVRQIRKFAHPEISTSVIICDQSRNDIYAEVIKEYFTDSDITVIWSKPLYSGYGVDICVRQKWVKTDYICQIHVDAVPIHPNWLYLPIKLIEEYNLSFVGQLHFVALGNDSIYPPNPFFSMSPTFNVARKETYEEMSKEAGFTRFHNRIDSGLEFKNKDWDEWASADYAHRGSDDDTVAFCWQDRHREVNKLGLAVTGFIQPQFGRIIENIIFHFGSCNEATLVMEQMPEKYREFTKRINKNYSDELINEMLELAKKNKPPEIEILTRNYWDGKLKKCIPIPDELNKRIKELKHE